MLVLKRKINQVTIIEGNIRVKVLEVGRNWVKLGIEAPREIEVLREEILERGKERN